MSDHIVDANKKVGHTPTPWSRSGRSIIKELTKDSFAIVLSSTQSPTEEDAKFICRAVNEYEWDQKRIVELERKSEALLEAAKEREALLDQCVALLMVVRPEIHEQALKRIGLTQKDFEALLRTPGHL